MNINAPGILRSWPADANWAVVLLHAKDGRYVCLTLTGQISNGNQYFFGVEQAPSNLYIVLADHNAEAVQGQTVNVLVDNTQVGSYAVDKQTSVADGTSIRAAVPPGQSEKLLSLLRVGGTVQFETGEATYSASLVGMADAMGNVQSCLTEASALAGGN